MSKYFFNKSPAASTKLAISSIMLLSMKCAHDNGLSAHWAATKKLKNHPRILY